MFPGGNYSAVYVLFAIKLIHICELLLNGIICDIEKGKNFRELESFKLLCETSRRNFYDKTPLFSNLARYLLHFVAVGRTPKFFVINPSKRFGRFICNASMGIKDKKVKKKENRESMEIYGKTTFNVRNKICSIHFSLLLGAFAMCAADILRRVVFK